MTRNVPVSYLSSRIRYENGILYWRKRDIAEFTNDRIFKNWSKRFSGKQAFTSIHKDGYKYGEIAFNGSRNSILAHVVVWAICKGSYPNSEIDHINGVRSDNRIENLRECTRSENIYNTLKDGKHMPGASPSGSMWKSQITVDKKSVYIGIFKTELEAHLAYVEKVNSIRGKHSPFLSRLT